MARSRFVSDPAPIIPKRRDIPPYTVLDMRGLDLTSPYDAIEKNRTPNARNFRVYAKKEDSRRVAISNAQGPELYSAPIGETEDVSSSLTGSTANIGITVDWVAVGFTPSASGSLTRLDLELSNPNTASGPLIAELRSDLNGNPGDILASSGCLGSDLATSASFVTFRFVEAPELSSGTQYWVSLRLQEDAVNEYVWHGGVSGTDTGKTSNTTANSWTDLGFTPSYKVFLTADTPIKGVARFTPDTGDNVTIYPVGTEMYQVDDNTNTAASIYSGLASAASFYDFTRGDDTIWWVNGVDSGIFGYDGSSYATNPDKVTNGSFETNTASWTAGPSTTLTRDTTQYYSGVASMKAVFTADNGQATSSFTADKQSMEFKLSMRVKGVAGNQVRLVIAGVEAPTFTLTGGWDLLEYTYQSLSKTVTYGITTVTTSHTIYVDAVSIKHTGFYKVTSANWDVLSMAQFHHNLIFGVDANDLNRVVFSEAPGNDDGANNFWYNAYLSTSYIDIPHPKANDPITAIWSFQDNLTVFTRTGKWILYGSDPGSFVVRQSTGVEGAVSKRAMDTDGNYLYFANDSGFWRFNGSSDDLLSDRVQTEFAGIADIDKVKVVCWKNQVRFYYPSSGSPVNDRCLIWDTALEEWMMDTDRYVSEAVAWTDGNDPKDLVEAGSNQPTLFKADKNPHNLGKQIDFLYCANVTSLGNPGIKKRVRRFYPFIEGEGGNYKIQVGLDRDLEDATRYQDFEITTSAPLIGSFTIGTNTKIGGGHSFSPRRVTVGGQGYYLQPRVKSKAIDNKVNFIGYTLSIKTRKL